MKQTYSVQGMTCSGCKSSVEKHLSEIEGVAQVSVHLEKAEAEIIASKAISASELNDRLPSKYTVSEQNIFNTNTISAKEAEVSTEEKTKLQQLKPLLLILGYITLASVLMNLKNWETRQVMLDFMGVFFFVFSFFKLLDVRGFAKSFAMYDPLANEFPVYGKIYPFIELALGIMFFIRYEIEIALALTICLLGLTTVGVTKALLDKKSIQCACLGTVLNLPMTLATFIENAIMIAMSLLMITSWV